MKKQYFIPKTTTVVFRSGFICQTVSGGGRSVGGNSGLGYGGESDIVAPM